MVDQLISCSVTYGLTGIDWIVQPVIIVEMDWFVSL